jgi:hypothetical protein
VLIALIFITKFTDFTDVMAQLGPTTTVTAIGIYLIDGIDITVRQLIKIVGGYTVTLSND